MALTSAQITLAFQNVLQRDPSAAELSAWLNASTSGALTDAQIYQSIVTSAEAQNGAAAVIRVYQAAFGRVPDKAGLDQQTDSFVRGGFTINKIAEGFVVSQEFANKYNGGVLVTDNAAAVTDALLQSLYQNVLGRLGSAAEIAAWKATLTTPGSGYTKASDVLIGFSQSPEFTAKAATAVNTFLTAAAQGTAVYSGALLDPAVGTGTTYTLTTAADNIPGTAGNDKIDGFVNTTAGSTTSTLTAADVIAGSTGTDTLNVTFDGTGASVLPGAAISGVEIFNLRNLSTNAAALAVNADTLVGATQIWNDRGVGDSDLTVTNLATGATGGVRGTGVAQISDSSFGYKTATSAASIAIDGGVRGGAGSGANAAAEDAAATTVTVSSTPTTVAITSTGGANTVNNIALGGAATALTIDATSDLTVSGAEFDGGVGVTLTDWITGFAANAKITVTGAGKVNLGTLQATNVIEVDSSGNAGGTTAALNGVTSIKFTGGAGQDIITTGAVLAGAGLVDAAGGTTDRLVVSNSAHIDATAGKLYKGFEQLQVSNGVTVDVTQLATNNTIDTIRINDGAAATGVTNLSAAQAAAVTILAANAGGAITIGIKDASVGGQIDTVKAALTTTTSAGAAQNIDISGITLAGIEKLELSSTGTVKASTGTVTFTAANATALDSITFKSVADGNTLTVNAITASNLNVDASASSGGVTIDASTYNTTTGATLKGGSSFDVLFGSTRGDSLNGGAGNDLIAGTAVGGSTAGTANAIGTFNTSIAAATVADSLTGGAGRDQFAIGRVDALANMSTITDLDLGTNAAAGGVDGLTFDLATPAGVGTVTIVTLTDPQKATVSGAASLAAAVEAALQIATGVNNVVQFTYGADTYVAINGATAGFAVGDDAIVKVTGLTGTLDNSDITVI